jgi:hypothetical protein
MLFRCFWSWVFFFFFFFFCFWPLYFVYFSGQRAVISPMEPTEDIANALAENLAADAKEFSVDQKEINDEIANAWFQKSGFSMVVRTDR